MIYLDNAATTFPKPEAVLEAVNYCQRNYAVNVGRGSYSLAKNAAECVDETRALMSSMVNARSAASVVFTPSATVAANEIILGLPWDRFKTVYVSPFEHNAIARPLYRICSSFGIEIKLLPFDATSQTWDEEETTKLFESDPPDYIFVTHVSNVTGLILPVEELAAKAHSYGAKIIVDGSQSLGLIPTDLQKTGIDYLIFAGHKNLYSSWGIGGFVANDDLIVPAICGGTGSDSLNLSMSSDYPVGYEAGSPNIIAIASLNASLKWLKAISVDTISQKKKALMDRLITGLNLPQVKLFLPENRRSHTSVLSFNISGYSANDVGTILSEDYDIAIRTGYHCAPFIHNLLGTEATGGTIRVSIGYFNTSSDIDTLINAVSEI